MGFVMAHLPSVLRSKVRSIFVDECVLKGRGDAGGWMFCTLGSPCFVFFRGEVGQTVVLEA